MEDGWEGRQGTTTTRGGTRGEEDERREGTSGGGGTDGSTAATRRATGDFFRTTTRTSVEEGEIRATRARGGVLGRNVRRPRDDGSMSRRGWVRRVERRGARDEA